MAERLMDSDFVHLFGEETKFENTFWDFVAFKKKVQSWNTNNVQNTRLL